MSETGQDVDLVWYAAYGSNLHLPRFRCYLEGGRPPGSSRTDRGCRDTSPPRRVAALWLARSMRFGGTSPVWGGGVAVLETGRPGRVAATAYLLSHEQVCDVVAQETRQECGAVRDLDAPPGGSGWYDILLRTHHEDHPAYAVAASAPPGTQAPTPGYLTTVVRGLMSSRGWSAPRCADYLAELPGMETWDRDAVTDLVRWS